MTYRMPHYYLHQPRTGLAERSKVKAKEKVGDSHSRHSAGIGCVDDWGSRRGGVGHMSSCRHSCRCGSCRHSWGWSCSWGGGGSFLDFLSQNVGSFAGAGRSLVCRLEALSHGHLGTGRANIKAKSTLVWKEAHKRIGN